MNVRLARNKWKIYGALNPKFLIAGHSHTFSIYSALITSNHSFKHFGVATHAEFKKPKKIDLSYWKFVVNQAKEKMIFIFWNGNQHNIHFLLDAYEPFNIFGLYENEIDAPAVSLNRVRALFKPTFDELREVIQLFPDTSKLVLVETPAPKTKDFIDSKIQSDEFFLKLAIEKNLSARDLAATSDFLRVSLWRLNNSLLNEISTEFHLPVIPTPAETIDENGLLKEIYYTDDLTHANELYGIKVLEILNTYLEKSNG